MKAIIRQADPEGRPLPGEGRIVSGTDCPALVKAMREETVFTADMHPLDYMNRTLALIGRHRPPLPQEPEAASEVFLQRLADAELIRFIPDDWPDELPETGAYKGKKEK